MLTLSVEKRDKIGKASKRRTGGKIPAVFYGPKEESTPITVSEKDFRNVWKEAGESSVIELSGVGDTKEALIHDVDVHPVTGSVRHADFYIIEKGKKLSVKVPLVFVGEAPAVKELSGTLVKVLHEIEIESLPKDLPHEITVDVSPIVDFETSVHVSDLQLPEGVTALAPADDVVVSASEVQEEPEEAPEEVDLESIEVEQKGKGEEGEGEGGDTSAPAEEKKE